MNLATRCTDCGTVFRVVEDQLKVSDGWVRCGRCSAVFNAQQHLFDLDQLPSPPVPVADIVLGDEGLPDPPGMRARSDAVTALESVSPNERSQGPTKTSDIPTSPTESEATWSTAGPQALSALAAMPVEGSPEVVVALGAPALASDTRADSRTDSRQDSRQDSPAVRIDPDETSLAPSFLRSSERGGFWRRPAIRGGMVALLVVLTLSLGLQAAVAWRDHIAAQVPALRPALAQLCQLLGCQISALRRVDQLSVDASGLGRVAGTALHRLSLTLRNRAHTEVLAPALDLSLTDAQGKLIARRVLGLAELGLAAATIGPGAELPLQALLATGNGRVSGYTVELFYP